VEGWRQLLLELLHSAWPPRQGWKPQP